MWYDAIVAKDGKFYDITFPDCVGCHTFAESVQEVPDVAREALEGWLEANLVERRVPPRPKHHKVRPRALVLPIRIGVRLSAALLVRWARQDKELSQAGLAELVGVTQQSIAKLEDPDGNPTLDTLEKVVKALGFELEMDFIHPPAVRKLRSGAGVQLLDIDQLNIVKRKSVIIEVDKTDLSIVSRKSTRSTIIDVDRAERAPKVKRERLPSKLSIKFRRKPSAKTEEKEERGDRSSRSRARTPALSD